jgi:excisionase family DNA binding protein
MDEMAPLDTYYTVDEVAEKLKVSRRVILEENRKGKLRGVGVGKNIRFSETALKEYLGEPAP